MRDLVNEVPPYTALATDHMTLLTTLNTLPPSPATARPDHLSSVVDDLLTALNESQSFSVDDVSTASMVAILMSIEHAQSDISSYLTSVNNSLVGINDQLSAVMVGQLLMDGPGLADNVRSAVMTTARANCEYNILTIIISYVILFTV